MPDTVKVHAEPSADAMRLPAIALRGLVVFPDNVIHFEVGREKSIAAIDWAMNNNSPVFLVTQKEMDTEQPGMEDLYTYGVIAEIKQMLRVSDELVKVLVEGKTRARLLSLESDRPFLVAQVRPAPMRGVRSADAEELEALLRSIHESFSGYAKLSPRLPKDVVYNILTGDDPVRLAEYIPANLLFKYQDKQDAPNEGTLIGRLKKILQLLEKETRVLTIEKEIQAQVSEQMDKNQRDYYLR